ncbi:helix-turn-helix domain-containing protein [Atopobium fossor]|uniref:helix-turn-helix domain-containing protein n=1 Tax=Atopobium fossor TaxID=39487 RepID=UPI00042864B0|nr:helix-turn-helix transcriptional regulator [Atopobium fossor]
MDISSNQTIGKNLKSIRCAHGITQLDLAERLNVNQSFLSKLESGERALRVYEVRWIAEVLDMSVADLATKLNEGISSEPNF